MPGRTPKPTSRCWRARTCTTWGRCRRVTAATCSPLLPAAARSVVDAARFGGLTAFDTRRVIYGIERRAVLTHSPELHEHQALGFDGTTLAKAGRRLDELAATWERGKTRRPRAKVEAEITKITHDPWVRRVITWRLDGEHPKDLRLTWSTDQDAHAALEEEIFGKHVLITDHDDWPAAEVIAGYRSQSEAGFSFRQLKVFTCVLALQIARLMRLKARQAERGRPRAHRMLTDTTPVQAKLSDIFGLARYAPRR